MHLALHTQPVASMLAACRQVSACMRAILTLRCFRRLCPEFRRLWVVEHAALLRDVLPTSTREVDGKAHAAGTRVPTIGRRSRHVRRHVIADLATSTQNACRDRALSRRDRAPRHERTEIGDLVHHHRLCVTMHTRQPMCVRTQSYIGARRAVCVHNGRSSWPR